MKNTLCERLLEIESAPANEKNGMLKTLRVSLTLEQAAMIVDRIPNLEKAKQDALDHIESIAHEGAMRDIGINVITRRFKP